MPSMFQPRVIWAALLASQGIYAFIMFGHFLEVPSEPPDPIMLPVLGGVAAMVAVMSFVLPRVLGRPAVAAAVADIRHRELQLPEIRKRAFMMGFTPFILSIALSEAVGIFGLVLFAVGYPLTTALVFTAASVVLIAVRFPTERAFLGPLEEALGRSLVG